MKRLLLAIVALATALGVMLAVRLRLDRRALSGPPSGSGTVEGTTIDLASRLGSRVLAVETREGTTVRAGQMLVRLDCVDAEAALAETRANLAVVVARVRAGESQIDAARSEHAAARAQAISARSQAEASEARRSVAENEARRAAALERSITDQSREAIEGAATAAAEESAAAHAAAHAGASREGAARAAERVASAEAEAAASEVGVLEAEVRRAQHLVDECVLRAPRDAWVDDVYFEVGELASPGATIVRLVDLARVKVVFYVPNEDLAAARTGARAQARADAYPNRTFSGRVVSVSTHAEFTPRNVQTRSDRDRLVYPIEVEIPNRDALLRPGMPVEVTLGEPTR